jgi:hypothetical protein
MCIVSSKQLLRIVCTAVSHLCYQTHAAWRALVFCQVLEKLVVSQLKWPREVRRFASEVFGMVPSNLGEAFQSLGPCPRAVSSRFGLLPTCGFRFATSRSAEDRIELRSALALSK